MPPNQHLPGTRTDATTIGPSQTIGGWTLLERLGSGAFGTTWRAVDCRGRQAAVKTLGSAPGDELRALASVVHPSVIGVIDSGSTPVPYIAMDLAPGEPLSQVDKPLTVPQSVQIIATLADALSALHDAGLAHGDVKSANVLVKLSAPIEVRLVDLGMAGTEAGGTLSYAAPERMSGDRSSPEADVYALGLILWELLHGELPWGALGTERALLRRRSRVPKPTVGPVWLRRLLTDCLALKPGARPSASSVADSLAEHGAVLPEPTPALVRRRARGVHVPVPADAAIQHFVEEGGSIALVGGAGTGRTHHLERIATELSARGMAFVRLQGDRRPWSAIQPALTDARLPGPPAAPMPPGSDEDRAQAAARGLLRRVDGPLTILVDDIDRLDSASRSVVDLLLRHRGARVCVTSGHAVPGAETIPLAELSQDRVHQLIVQLLGSEECASALAEPAFKFSSGNPHLAIGWIAAAVEHGAVVWRARTWVVDPSRIPGVRPSGDGRERVDHLPEPVRVLGAAIALFARPVEVSTLVHITNQSREQVLHGLLRLVDADLVRIEAELVQAANGAVGGLLATAVDDIRPLHAAIAMQLLDTFPAPLMRIAWHAAHADDASLVHIIGADALREAMDRDINEAAELAEALWACCPDDLELGLLRIRALAEAGHTERALQVGNSIAEERSLSGRLLLEMARAHLADRKPDKAMELIGRVRELPEANSLDAMEVEVSALFHLQRYAEAVQRAAELSNRPPRTTAKLDAWLNCKLHYAQSLHGLHRTGEAVASLEAIDESIGDGRRTRARVDGALGRLLWESGRFHDAGVVYLRASRATAGLPLIDRARLANNAALASYRCGALTEALARWERARLLFERLGDPVSQIAVQLNMCVGYREVGRWTRGQRAGEWALATAEAEGHIHYAAMAAGNLGDLHFALERWDVARSTYERALELSRDSKQTSEEVECLRRLAAVDLAEGRDAGPAARTAITAAEAAGQDIERWRAVAIQAVSLARAGDTTAMARMERALEGLRELKCTRELAEARLGAAEILVANGRQADAVATLAQVVHYAEDVGSIDLSQRAQRVSERLDTRLQVTPDTSSGDRALSAAALIASEPNLSTALGLLAQAAIDLASAERAFVVLLKPELHVAASAGAGPDDEPAWPLVQRALRSARELIVADLGDRPDLRESTTKLLLELRAVMVMPLNHDGATLGALVIDGRNASEQQLLRAQSSLRSLGAVAASSIQREAYLRYMLDQRRELAASNERMERAVRELATSRETLSQEVRSPIALGALSQLRQSCLAMIDAAETYARAAAPATEPVDLGALCREVSAMVRPNASADDILVDVDAAHEAWVEGAEHPLRRAVFSLLSRAVHCSAPRDTVRLHLRRDNDDFFIEVSNSGPQPPSTDLDALADEAADSPTRHAVRVAAAACATSHGELQLSLHTDGTTMFTLRLPALDSLAG